MSMDKIAIVHVQHKTIFKIIFLVISNLVVLWYLAHQVDSEDKIRVKFEVLVISNQFKS